jgi:hypothetical protein
MPYFGILGKEAYHVNKHIEKTRLLDWLNKRNNREQIGGEQKDGRKTIYYKNRLEMER